MSLNTTFVNLGSRFNAMTLRERGMIAIALLALLVLVWDQLFMAPLHARKQKLAQEIQEVQTTLAALTETIEGRAHDNPLTLAMEQKQSLTQSLAAVDSQLESASAGLIAPQRMLAALRDVLNSQQGLRLVSMRNFPVVSLTAPVARPIDTSPAFDTGLSIDPKPLRDEKTPLAVAATGPYVHSLELVVEGSYLDVMRYLQSVEALPWRFYWQVFELKTTEYPINRVRVRLNTISMDKAWLGV